MIVFDVRTFREEMVNQSVVMARVVAGYSVSELAFQDEEQANLTLSKLSAIPELSSAQLFDRFGERFASYQRDRGAAVTPPFMDAGHVFAKDHLHVVQPVIFDGERYGTLFLSASTEGLREKIQGYLTVVVILIVILIGLSFFAAFNLQAVISGPILSLAETARQVSQSGDYGTRVVKEGHDEVGTLYDAWNEMLGQIESRQQQQEKVEAALRRSEQRFRRISEESNDSIYVIRDDGTMAYVNPKFEALLGFTAEEVLRDDFEVMSMVAEESRPFLRQQQELRRSGQGFLSRYEFQALSKSGEVFDVEVNTAEIQWDQSPARLGIIRNISERKRVEKKLREQQQQLSHHAQQLEIYARELERSNRDLDQFAYVVSHDLRAPLRAIANLSTWIEEDLGPVLRDGTHQQMDLLRRRVQRMENLINGILEYSRVGRVQTAVAEVDVATMIRDVIDDLAPPPTCSIQVTPDLPTLTTNHVRLAQVFGNLIGNALKHHDREDGQIVVGCRELERFYEFSISDDGPGIDPKYHSKIFLMFQTLKPRDIQESTGVGLALVKKIVEDQGGTLRLESEEGQGATFVFTWPKKPPPES
jgi:PAS domain S-box-containing protein